MNFTWSIFEIGCHRTETFEQEHAHDTISIFETFIFKSEFYLGADVVSSFFQRRVTFGFSRNYSSIYNKQWLSPATWLRRSNGVIAAHAPFRKDVDANTKSTNEEVKRTLDEFVLRTRKEVNVRIFVLV